MNRKEIKEFLETLHFHGYIDHDITKLDNLIDDYYPKQLQQADVRRSLPSDVYTEIDIDKAYKCGERQSTFYKKNGTVILPRNYEGVDG